jgi:hypothetical protein
VARAQAHPERIYKTKHHSDATKHRTDASKHQQQAGITKDARGATGHIHLG